MEITGTINQLLPEQSGTSKAGKEWKKREFVIDVANTQYPRQICFTMFGDEKVAKLDGIQQGAEVKVQFDIDSREYNGRWYTNVNAWAIDTVAGGGMDTPPDFTPADVPAEQSDDNDDLPF